jgi:hypothetical protein
VLLIIVRLTLTFLGASHCIVLHAHQYRISCSYSSSVYFWNICVWVLLLLKPSSNYSNWRTCLCINKRCSYTLSTSSRCSSWSILLNLIQRLNSICSMSIGQFTIMNYWVILRGWKNRWRTWTCWLVRQTRITWHLLLSMNISLVTLC